MTISGMSDQKGAIIKKPDKVSNKLLPWFFFFRERPAAIPIEIKSIDDTSNFDEFPDSDILTPTGTDSLWRVNAFYSQIH